MQRFTEITVITEIYNTFGTLWLFQLQLVLLFYALLIIIKVRYTGYKEIFAD